MADVVRDPAMRPVTVGIFGTWGTGKSTLLNLIESRLTQSDGSSEFIVVRFDAWLYQGFDDSRAALMEVIASTLIQASEETPHIFAKARRLLGRVNSMRALGLLIEGGALAMGVPTFGLATKGVTALGDLVNGLADEEDVTAITDAGADAKKRATSLLNTEKQRTPPKEIAAFRLEFEDVLTALGKTLVVFVDNLDRCLPKQTIHTLEALRLFLFMGHTAFVVAADEDMVRHSVSEYFRDPGERHVTDYLDKLIQVPVRVPRLGTQEVRAYLFLLFASAGGVDPKSIEDLRQGLEQNLMKAWEDEPISTEQALAFLGRNPSPEVTLGFGIADRMAPMLANSILVQGNPRIVKRMLNVVRMRSRVAKLRGMRIDEALIAKMVLFERCTDVKSVAHLYAEINAAASGKPQIFVTLEHLLDDQDKFKAACPEQWSIKSDFLRQWLSLEPPLSQVDLRPLVYLSRETTPVRSQRGGLSAPAADAQRVLLKTVNTSSPSGNSVIRAIPTGEHANVMSGLIENFRSHTDWSTKPQGFDGALMLAESSLEAGELLAGFIRTVMPTKLKPWLSILVKRATWYKTKETT